MAILYRLKITVTDAPVAITRTIEVPDTLSLNQFHLVLQAVMGWQNAHLYHFEKDNQLWTHPAFIGDMWEFATDAELDIDVEVVLCMLLQKVGDRLQYLYDFGDHWLHDIQLISVVNREFSLSNAVTLLEAEGACPPEDVGGIPGYTQMLEAFAGDDAEELTDFQTWLGCEHWDALAPDSAALTQRIQQVNALLLQSVRARFITWKLSTSAYVNTTPIMQVLAQLLSILYAGPLKLTVKGNLPLKLVQAMFNIEQTLPCWQQRRFKVSKIHSEQESALISISRLIAQKSGLVKLSGNKLQLTKTGEKLLLAQDHGKIYQKLLAAALDKLRWTSFDGYPDFSFYQLGLMPMLDYLQKSGEEISSDVLIDMLRQWLPEFDVETYDDYIDDAFVSRFKFIGELFGLINVKPLPDDELYPLRDRFSVSLQPEAAAMLRFLWPGVGE
jgi:hypothetical protein